ncbi:hypothetical protein K1719_020656 [Acacia pycnantha]|nr:hypothetical protein K1719_020656 [Acacia pycnantha]
MEQFRRIGEVVGSLRALMVLRDEIQLNQSQCCLILNMFNLAFETIAEEIKQNLVLEERNTKWKPLEYPMRQLCRVFKEAELYIRQCLDSKDWWGKAISLHHNNDCVEFHIHNLLCHFPAVIEAIEIAGEISGHNQDEMAKKKVMLMRKYDREWNDPKLFQWGFGKQYLVSGEIIKELENSWREDQWRLIESLKQKKKKKNNSTGRLASTKNVQGLADMLIKKLLNGPDKLNKKNFPSSILLGSKDYQVRRRLGSGREFKEIHWMGHSFALRHVNGEMQISETEIYTLLSLSHPNIVQYLCGFHDEEKREFFLVMELMNKDLESYMKESYGPRKQILFSIPVVVDIMLQMARGMEYLHSKKVYHGDLNPCNILLKSWNSQEGYFQVKVTGFGSSMKTNPLQEEINPSIWYYAPEVLTELESKTNASSSSCKCSEKADVYSFSMVCFQLLTGKMPPFEGDGSNRNIREGERPLFPYPSPKYLVNLIKKCWHTDPNLRPSFSSICRILRSIKKFLAINTEFLIINPELNQLELTCPPVDYCDIEALFLKNFPAEKASHLPCVSQLPYEMFAYKIFEKEKTGSSISEDNSSISKEENDTDVQKKASGDENAYTLEDPGPLSTDSKSSSSESQSICSEVQAKRPVRIKRQTEDDTKKNQGALRLQPSRSLATNPPNYNSRMNRGSGLASSKGRRTPQVLDSKNNNKRSPSTPLTKTSSSIRRIRNGEVASPKGMPKTKTGNESPLTRRGQLFDSKSSLQMKKGFESPLTRSIHVLDPSLKVKKGNESPFMASTRKIRHSNLKMTSGNMSPYATSPFSFNTTCSRRCGQDSNLDLTYKMDRGRISPFTTSPLSSYVRAYGHISQPQKSLKMKRASLSPLKLSPLSLYTQRNGHVSD